MIHVLVLASITQTLSDWVAQHGVYAIFAIMAVDAVFPAGGELTMLVAGAVAGGAIASHDPVVFGHTMSTGALSFVVLALAGTLGYLTGALVGWSIGRWGGQPLLERHGRWFHLGDENLDRAEAWFARHGRAAVFLGRLTPVVRSFISVPAGAMESPLGSYTVLSLAGSAIWCYAFAGLRMGTRQPVRQGRSCVHRRRGPRRRGDPGCRGVASASRPQPPPPGADEIVIEPTAGA
ncbi:MAG TPA: DedA family protein [Baekduia sp.]|nr:DedA family protein [Baekduia sp.]